MEYALGLSPGVGRTAGEHLSTLVCDEADGQRYLCLMFRRRVQPEGLVYAPEFSGDAVTWVSGSAHASEIAVTPMNDEFERVTCRDLVPIRPRAPRFAQLRVGLSDATPPRVDVTLPGGRDAFVVGTDVTIGVSSSDPDGYVVGVQVYVNGVLVAQTGAAPLEVNWHPSVTGDHTLTVRATDNLGLVSNYGPTTIAVDFDNDGDGIPNVRDPRPAIPNVPPTIRSVTPASSRNFHNEGSLAINVSADDLDGDPVRFALRFDGATVVGLQNSEEMIWGPPPTVHGLVTLEVAAVDPWGALAVANTPVFLFRAPPRPMP
jgi:hypothetical protein